MTEVSNYPISGLRGGPFIRFFAQCLYHAHIILVRAFSIRFTTGLLGQIGDLYVVSTSQFSRGSLESIYSFTGQSYNEPVLGLDISTN